MLTQLNPWLRFITADGDKVWAMMALDYSQEHDTLFLCGLDDSRELWWIPHSELRMSDNISFGRPAS